MKTFDDKLAALKAMVPEGSEIEVRPLGDVNPGRDAIDAAFKDLLESAPPGLQFSYTEILDGGSKDRRTYLRV